MRIEDGKGSHGDVSVSYDQRLEVSSRGANRIYYASKDRGDAYIAYGKRNFAAANTDEGILYFKYTGDRLCVIDQIIFSSSSVDGKAEVFFDYDSCNSGQQNEVQRIISDGSSRWDYCNYICKQSRFRVFRY